MRVGSPSTLKKRRLTTIDPMEIESVRERLEAAKQKFGREIRVFETSAASSVTNDASSTEVSDDFYEFTTEDYYRLLGTKKEDKFLKTKKIREREEAARRSKITKAVIRVRFPDNYTLEATFHPSEKIQSLYELLNKVIAQPELPFYIYTTPPKKQVKDMSQDFFAAGFVPGAIVYFSYDLPKVTMRLYREGYTRIVLPDERPAKMGNKAVIRVRFPDNYTLEATFHPSEKIQSLYELLNKVIAQPELPFYIYTTPPKKQVKDMSQDFFAAGFVPGAIVYFSYDLPKGDGDGGVSVSSSGGPFLDEDVLSLNGLELPPVEAAEPAPQAVTAEASPSQAALPERKPTTDKKPAKPKWLKL